MQWTRPRILRRFPNIFDEIVSGAIEKETTRSQPIVDREGFPFDLAS